MLLVFVVETIHTNDSDKMYVDKYLKTRFSLDESTVVRYIYMNGKANSERIELSTKSITTKPSTSSIIGVMAAFM